MDIAFSKIAEFTFYLLIFLVGQICAEIIKMTLFKKDDKPLFYSPCPAMEKEHVERFLKAFEQQARSQESILLMLRQIAVTVQGGEAEMAQHLEDSKEPYKMIRDIHHKIVETPKKGTPDA